MFEENVKNWLEKNGFVDLEVVDDDEFRYDIDNKVIYTGVVSTSEGIWFEQFESDHGMKITGIIPEVLAFLHEVGHYCTVDNFGNNDREDDNLNKFFIDMIEDSHDRMIKYWNLPMEFAANMWVVDFVNNNIDAVKELCDMWEVCE